MISIKDVTFSKKPSIFKLIEEETLKEMKIQRKIENRLIEETMKSERRRRTMMSLQIEHVGEKKVKRNPIMVERINKLPINDLQRQILFVLYDESIKENPKLLKAIEIAKRLYKPSVKHINPDLYKLKNDKLVESKRTVDFVGWKIVKNIEMLFEEREVKELEDDILQILTDNEEIGTKKIVEMLRKKDSYKDRTGLKSIVNRKLYSMKDIDWVKLKSINDKPIWSLSFTKLNIIINENIEKSKSKSRSPELDEEIKLL